MKAKYKIILKYFLIGVLLNSSFSFIACKNKELEIVNIHSKTASTASKSSAIQATGKKCEAIWYNSISENPRCYKLQEKLINASRQGNVQQMTDALTNGAAVDGGYATSFTALYTASTHGQNAAIELLLDNGANINRVFNFGTTPLKVAVFEGKIDTVRLLIAKGVNICDNSPDEGSALQIAQRLNIQPIVDMLEKAGADACN